MDDAEAAGRRGGVGEAAGDGADAEAVLARLQLQLLRRFAALEFRLRRFFPFFAGFLTRAHSKVAPAVVELKRKVTVARLPLVVTFFFGPLSIFVSGRRSVCRRRWSGRPGGSRPLMRATSSSSSPGISIVTQIVLFGPGGDLAGEEFRREAARAASLCPSGVNRWTSSAADIANQKAPSEPSATPKGSPPHLRIAVGGIGRGDQAEALGARLLREGDLAGRRCRRPPATWPLSPGSGMSLTTPAVVIVTIRLLSDIGDGQQRAGDVDVFRAAVRGPRSTALLSGSAG